MTVVINHYLEGQTIKLKAVFSVEGQNQDPTTITLMVLKPGAQSVDTYTFEAGQIARDGTGVYTKVVALDIPGLWWYRFESTGTVEAAGEKKFTVTASHVV